jgi:hypothetical protein
MRSAFAPAPLLPSAAGRRRPRCPFRPAPPEARPAVAAPTAVRTCRRRSCSLGGRPTCRKPPAPGRAASRAVARTTDAGAALILRRHDGQSGGRQGAKFGRIDAHADTGRPALVAGPDRCREASDARIAPPSARNNRAHPLLSRVRRAISPARPATPEREGGEPPVRDKEKPGDRRRRDLDRGPDGEKVNDPGPAVAPSGADDEAGGTPPTSGQVGMANPDEVGARRNDEPIHRSRRSKRAVRKKATRETQVAFGSVVVLSCLLIAAAALIMHSHWR